ncbi:P60-like protein [Corchorus capsularis]|uniref:Ribosome biogenesis protein NOP53 n=1 Tax=Corchorus capsularis TaxID=210143 RepID=A0A1R3FVV9_COCAP|nr:P60-like protein [Corchorus capsularis]
MGKKSKSSRKGKKAWRANISTEDIHDFYEKSTKDALSGGSLASAPAESLFTIDKSKDLSVKRKIEKKREKVLRVDSLLQKNPFVEAVPSSKQKQKKSKKEKKETLKAKDVVVQDVPKDDSAPDSSMVPLWGNEGQHSGKARQVSKQSIIPAVEVEPPGCSYNPTFESHQDSLAQAVAEEMQIAYKIELGPQPVPLTVMGEAVEEEDKYFLDADVGSDDEMDEENLSENEDPATEKRPSKTKRVTRVELNKRARRKEVQRKEAEAKKKKELSKEIDSIPDILQEIAKEDEEKEKKHLRRVIAKQERLKACPPRLGKYKFKPAPPQVLLSEELTGSLRKLKGCSTLARDRFKSLEKRGLIPPSAKSGRPYSPRVASSRSLKFKPELLFKRKPCNVQSRNFSSSDGKDEAYLEQEAERKIGWVLKLIFAGTATYVGYQFFPYMGDNLMHQSVSLLHVKDPLFKRMGASRLTRFAIDDERRMKIVEIGGAQELLNMLGSAKDERTQKEALKALNALSKSDEAAKALHHAGAISILKSTPDTYQDAEIGFYKSHLLKRFEDLH